MKEPNLNVVKKYYNALVKEKKKYVFYPLAAIGSAISAYGIYAFVKRQFPNYMLRKTAFVFFDYSEPRLFFFLDYLTVMVLFALLGWGIMRLCHRSSNGA